MIVSSFVRVSIRIGISCCLLMSIVPSVRLSAQEQVEESTTQIDSHALILVGLPGDADHEKTFNQVVGDWMSLLTERLRFSEKNIHILGIPKPQRSAAERQSESEEPERNKPRGATRERIENLVDALEPKLKASDRLWVFLLGHADYDGDNARFHIPGRDLTAVELAGLFDGIKCREQVFWLTNSCSGWFMDSFSKSERIVITATADDSEFNETEFPSAFVKALNTPAGKLDLNSDDQVSIAEVFVAVVAEVEAIYEADMRAPTEHAQLDDNGDARGTEVKDIRRLVTPKADDVGTSGESDEDAPDSADKTVATAGAKRLDGRLAAATFLPLVLDRKSESRGDQPSDSTTSKDKTP